MSLPKDVPILITRIAEGSRDPYDFDRVFLWLRERSFGNGLVKDLGDFVAHSHDRDQGHIVSLLNRFCLVLKIIHWSFWSLGHSDKPNPNVNEISAVALASVSFRSNAWCLSKLKMQKAQCIQYIKSACRKISGLNAPEGPLVFQISFRGADKLNQRERDVLDCFVGGAVDSVFQCDDLIEQLEVVLSKNGIADSVIQGWKNNREFVGLYLISLMHGTRVRLHDATDVFLYLNLYEYRLAIFGDFTVPWGDTQSAVHNPVFVSDASLDWSIIPNDLQAEQFRETRLEIRDGKLAAVV